MTLPNDQTNYSFADVDESCDFFFDKTFSMSDSDSDSHLFHEYDIPKNLYGSYEVTVNAKVWDEIHGDYFKGVRIVLCTVKNDRMFFMHSEDDDDALWHMIFKTDDFNRAEDRGLALKIDLVPFVLHSCVEGSIEITLMVRIQMRFNRLVKARNVERMLQDIQNVIEEYNDQPGNKHNQETYQKLIVEKLV